jgi:AraC family transcriptional regulator
VAQVHPAHLARVFRRHFGSSPGGYVRRLRIERAQVALATTDEPIAAIALSAGFASQAHFTHAFHRMVGIPPGTYRRQLRGDPERAKSASAARNAKDSGGTSL